MWPGNPFLHPAWIAAHAEVLEPALVVERWGADHGCPTLSAHHPDGGPLRLLGDRLSDRIDVPPDVLDHLLDAAASRGTGAELGPMPLPVALGAAKRRPAATVTEVVSCPTVAFAGAGWDEYLDGRPARRRRRAARQAAQAVAAADVTIDDASAADTIGPALDVLADLHRRRFGDRSQSFEPAKLACLHAALGPMADDHGAVIRVLCIDGRPAAAMLCLMGDGAMWFYQGGWDPDLGDRSVGRTLLADTLRGACEEGLDFHLLRGDEAYKTWWATGDEPVATVVMAAS